MTDQHKALAFGLAAVLCWSTVATAFKLSLRYLSPAQLVLLSVAVAWVLLLSSIIAQGRLGTLQSLSRVDWWHAAGLGLINPALYYLVLFAAYDLLPAQEAQAINYTWALTMTLLAVPLLGHRLLWRELTAVVISYLGVVVIATRGNPLSLHFESPAGVVLALLSTLLWALYWLLNTRSRIDREIALLLNFTFALPVLLIYCALTGELRGLEPAGLPGAAWVGAVEMTLGFLFWLAAMRLTSSTARIASLIFLAPFLSLIFIALILEEPVLPSTLAGLALILSGLALQQIRRPGAA